MVLAVVLKMAFAGDEKAGGGPGGRGGPGGGRGQAVSEAVVGARSFTDEIRVLGVARGRRSVNITSSTSELITRVLSMMAGAAGAPCGAWRARKTPAIEVRACGPGPAPHQR
jgi:membrane fusion protein (multidrug efflux system)